MRSPRQPSLLRWCGRAQRGRATLVLLVFAAALLSGLLLHPLGGALPCPADHAHAHSEPTDSHDESSCAFCHLALELSQTLVSEPSFSIIAPLALRVAALAEEEEPTRGPLLSYFARGPPCV